MVYAAMIAIMIYYLAFYVYYKKLYPAPGVRWPYMVLSVCLITAVYIVLNMYDLRFLSIPLIMLTMAAGLRLSTGMSMLQATYGGGMCVLSVYSIRGILTSLCAFFLLERRPDFFVSSDSYYLMTTFVLPLALVLFAALRKTIFPDDKLRRFLSDTASVRLVVAYELTAGANYAIVNQGRYIAPHVLWYIGITLGSGILTLGMLLYAVHHAIKSTELTEYRWRNRLLEEHLTRQLRHYRSYQKYTQSLRSLRHDMKPLMTSLKALIRAQRNEEAMELLDSTFDSLQRSMQIHRRYADNEMFDAMLQDLANQCEERGIRFSCSFFTTRGMCLSLLDSVRIFTNVTSNAVEACRRLPREARFIDVTAVTAQGWTVLQVVNAYDGHHVVENGAFVTTKEDRENHGLGLAIVREIAEQAGGFLVFDANTAGGIFKMRVHIPASEEAPSTEQQDTPPPPTS